LRTRAADGDDLDCNECSNLAQELAALGEDLEQAVQHATAVLERMGSTSGPEAMGHVLVSSVLVLADRPIEAALALEGALAKAQARGSHVEVSVALTMASYCALRRGKLLDAIEHAETALELTPDNGPV
jgi:hypothetical protein